jgi:hypothetical protein
MGIQSIFFPDVFGNCNPPPLAYLHVENLANSFFHITFFANTHILIFRRKGQVELAWDKIDKVEFNRPSRDWPCGENDENECYEKYLSTHSSNVIFANGDKMKTNFYAFKNCGYNLHGKSDIGNFKINAVYIKTGVM